LKLRWWGGPLLLGVLAACGGATLSGDDVVVEMFDNRFSAEDVHIPVGGKVTFLGAGDNPHNAVAADGSWSTESAFGSLTQLVDDAATLTFDEVGE